MKRISSEVEARIVEMWFEGLPRDSIARGVGGGPVSAVISSFPACLETLRAIAVANRKNNLTPAEALEGTKVAQQLGELGVTPAQVPFFVETFKKMASEAEYQPGKIVQAALEIAELEFQSGKKYADALSDYKKIIRRIARRRVK